MIETLSSFTLQGIEAFPVNVEVNTGESGDPRIVIVGLPDTAVKESQDRVKTALINSGFTLPKSRTIVNLAPGNIKKEGPIYDLPIALGILSSLKSIDLPKNLLDQYVIAAELSLKGELRPIRGGLAMAIMAKESGKRGIILPPKSAEEASLVDGIDVFPASNLLECIQIIQGNSDLQPLESKISERLSPLANMPDFRDVKGQFSVRRAVEIAVAGDHNIVIIGPPGSGKSMIAKRISGIMPPPSLDELLEILAIQSAAGFTLQSESNQWFRPFRSPHHTISDVGLLGGGSIPGPGEISLAHNGVLFLDELPEYKRSALEVMRQPLENGEVTISRSAGTITLPASFMLVAAMNPCPCGYLGSKTHECRCSPPQIQKYRSKISGPLLDRIDIHVEAPALSIDEIQSKELGESSSRMRERIETCRNTQNQRFKESRHSTNANMESTDLRTFCQLNSEQNSLLKKAMEELDLSARAYDRILKVSRTIADLEASATIQTHHLLEAIQYRSLDRNLFSV